MMRLKVNSKYWNFILTSESNNLTLDNKLLRAVIHYRTKTVYIDKNYFCEGVDVERLIIHELVHIFIYETQSFQGLYDEEFVCEFLAQYLKTILRCCKKVIRGLNDDRQSN